MDYFESASTSVRIPLSNANLGALESAYVGQVLATGQLSGTGDFVRRFEDGIAKRIGRKHVIAVCSGTAALELALEVLGIRAGDEIIVPALTFVAPAAAVVTSGAQPVFADVSPDTWTIDPEDVMRVITPRTRAIIAVDFLGHPCDYERLEPFGLPIIEDAAEAHGSAYKGRPVGSFGTMAIFSFHGSKTISTGEGGCITTDDDAVADRIRLLVSHGMSATLRYRHAVVGHNLRMTNLSAAVGLAQVERWQELVEGRRTVAKRYDRLFSGVDLQRRPVARWAEEACWLYTTTTSRRSQVLDKLQGQGIDARAIPLGLCDLPLYGEAVRGNYRYTRRIAAEALWLPTWAGMPAETTERVAEAVVKSLSGAGLSVIPTTVGTEATG